MNLAKKLADRPRLLAEVQLRPLQGTRFQPTGFPDIGAAEYQGFDSSGAKQSMLLVESAQSMANRMEAVIWDDTTQDLIEPLKGLPYVRVNNSEGAFLTCSLLEAHRLNSAYILSGKDKGFRETLKKALKTSEKGRADLKLLADTLLKYDPNSLVHGIFLAQNDIAGGRMRLPRALTSFIEAAEVERAASGGVKNDIVDPGKAEGRGAAEGFGNVPFHRDEYAGKPVVYFNLDVAQIRGYRFAAEVEELLIALSLLKIRLFLERGLRLRTACDFEASDIKISRPKDFELPDSKTLLDAMPALIAKCKAHFANPAITTVVFE